MLTRLLVLFVICNIIIKIENIKLGVLRSDGEPMDACRRAIDQAISEGNCISTEIELLYKNSCIVENQVLGTIHAAQLYYEDKVNAYIGPSCIDEFQEMGRLSYFWKKPLFARKMANKRMLDYDMYPNVVQMSLTSSAGLTKAVVEAVKVLSPNGDIRNISITGPDARNADHYPIAQAIFDYLQTDPLVPVSFFGMYNERTTYPVSMRDKIFQNGSKIVIAGGDFEYGDYMKTMELDQLTDTGHIVIVVFTEPISMFSETTSRFLADTVDIVIAPLLEPYDKLAEAVNQVTTIKDENLPDAMSLYLSCYAFCYAAKSGSTGDTQSYYNNFKNSKLSTSFGTFEFDASASLLTNYGVYKARGEGDKFKLLFSLKSDKFGSCDGTKCFDLIKQDILDDEVAQTFWNTLISRQKHICAWTSQCTTYIGYYIGWSAGSLIFLLIYVIYKWRKQARIKFFRMHWRIRKDNLKIIENQASVRNKGVTGGAEGATLASKRRVINSYALIGTVKAEFMAMKQKKKIKWSRQELKYVYELKQLNHDNIAKFMGICCNEMANFYVLHAVIERASLEDFIKDTTFVMDTTFLSAFIRDILKGLTYLHKSAIGNHGLLTSANCLIDSNWVLKLANFGVASMMHEFVKNGTLEMAECPQHKFYVVFAPELLRETEIGKNYARGTITGDIYSFGMILYQLTYRMDPYENTGLNMKDVLTKIMDNNLKPEVENVENDVLQTVMVQCWDPIPDSRPKLRTIHQTVATAFASTQGHLVDQMLKMNERYAQNLEKIVDEKNAKIHEAQEKTIRLLNELLPKSIAQVLKTGGTVPPRSYDHATVLFAQICDFQVLVNNSSPEEVIDFLNNVYDRFDSIIRNHDAYKVETTGETYMVASGVPNENDGKHVVEIAEISLEIREASYLYKVTHLPDFKIRVKIGFHCGPIAAGVIGIRSPRYCLFGDTVNFASRMQSNCPPNQIQTSEVTALKLMVEPNVYELVKRGIVQVKGKGAVNCYWLNEHVHDSVEHPLQPSTENTIEKIAEPCKETENIQENT